MFHNSSNNNSNNNTMSHHPSAYEEEEDDMDGLTLKETVARGCKRIDVGACVLPKPLFVPDYDEEFLYSSSHHDENTHEEDNYDDKSTTATTTTTTTRYARTLAKEFNAIVIEHHLKWVPLCQTQPGPIDDKTPSLRWGRYDFHHVDSIVDWALQNGIKVKGHVLCWHVTSPEAWLEQMTSEQVSDALKRHIFTTMGHFRHRIKVWDVVNESLAPDGSLAQNIFWRKMGPSYIEKAFRWAHEADPSATLLYNDNKVEGMGPHSPNPEKSDGFYKLLQDLIQKGVPVHGCGIQAHFDASGTGRKRPPTPAMVKAQIHRLGKLGLTVNVSEMDVRVSKLPANVRQIAQTQIYRDIVAAALTEPAFDGIWLWGFTDRHTWVTNFYHEDEPLILDEEYGRKEAYYGLRDGLATMCPGGTVGGGCPLNNEDDDTEQQQQQQQQQPWGYLWMQPEPENDTDESVPVEGGDDTPDWLQPSS